GDAPLAEHLDAYDRHLQTAGVSTVYRKNVLAACRRVFDECGFIRVAELGRGGVESWLGSRLAEGMSARSRNAYREAVNAFCNWCVRADPPRMRANPFSIIAKANVNTDPRRRRRALTEGELSRLLTVAATRPLAEARTVRRGMRKGQQFAQLKAETVQ